jgi:hypothetical protein
VTRWALATLLAFLVLGVVTVAMARFFGKSGSRASLGVSVAAHWLAAYVLWSFAGGLAVTTGLISAYHNAPFAAIAVLGALWQYQTHVRWGRERALALFVGVQLAWLLWVLSQNGMFLLGW